VRRVRSGRKICEQLRDECRAARLIEQLHVPELLREDDEIELDVLRPKEHHRLENDREVRHREVCRRDALSRRNAPISRGAIMNEESTPFSASTD
jgi:hypothetical protein